MDTFWTLARRLWTKPRLVVLAMAFAVLSAGGLGAGLLAIQPVLENVLSEDGGKGLPELAAELNANEWVNGRIPEAWIDALPSGAFVAIAWIMGGLGLLTIFGATANFLHQFFALTAVQHTITDIRRSVFDRVIHLPLGSVVHDGASDTVSRIVNDTEALAQGFTALLSKAISQLTKGAAAFIAALIINWKLALAGAIVAPALAVVLRKLGKRIRRAARLALRGRAGLFGAATETLQGLRVVKVHTTEDHEAQRFDRLNREVLRQQLRVRTARALASPLTEVLAIVVLGGLTLVAFKLILEGSLDRDKFILTLAALGVCGASLKPLAGLVSDIQASAAAADRIVHLLDAPKEPGREPDLPPLARHRKSITFDRAKLTYPGAHHAALDDVSMTIDAGQTVAFVGPNGSGKTTLLSLVPRLYDPDAGRVLIDGQDITLVSIGSLRAQISVVTQETVLFNRTIRENVAYGLDDIDDQRVRDALVRARAVEFVEALPDGLDAVIGEQGKTLSGGQRQRLAIARAILRDPAILILDEATSMIDADSESKIAQAIADFSAGRTCLIVAHRLSTVVNADRIVVMDAGRVVDAGTHNELLDRCAIYRDLARHQLVEAKV